MRLTQDGLSRCAPCFSERLAQGRPSKSCQTTRTIYSLVDEPLVLRVLVVFSPCPAMFVGRVDPVTPSHPVFAVRGLRRFRPRPSKSSFSKGERPSRNGSKAAAQRHRGRCAKRVLLGRRILPDPYTEVFRCSPKKGSTGDSWRIGVDFSHFGVIKRG